MTDRQSDVAVSDAAAAQNDPARDRHWLDAERARVYSLLILVIFGIIEVWWLYRSLPGLVDPYGKPVGYDFIAFWSAARLALQGHPAAAFDWSAMVAMHHVAVPALPADKLFLWHYPPTYLLLVLPLGLLPYSAALPVFVAATTALWAALVSRITSDRRAWIVAAAAPAGLVNLLDSQNGFLTASCAGFAILLLRRRPVVAGMLIGCLAIKPHLAVLFPLALLAERQWRAIAAAALTTVLFTAVAIAAFGATTALAFLHDIAASRALIDSGAIPWGAMPSPYVFALSLGASPAAAAVLQGVVGLAAAACVYRAWRNSEAPFEGKAACLLAGSLLVSPFLFNYDMTWAALAAGFLALLGLRSGFRRGEREVLLFVWVAPFVMQPIQQFTGVQIGCPALLLLLAMAMQRCAPLTAAQRERMRAALDCLREARWISRARVMRWGVALAVGSIGILMITTYNHTRHGFTDLHGDQLADDFINYYAGARLAATGLASHIFDIPWFYAFEQSITGTGSGFKFYGYPPTAVMLSMPLALFSFVPALLLWVATGTALCIVLLRRLVGWRAAVIAMIGAPPAFANLLGGQNGCFTAALLAGGLMQLERRPVVAGICFGLLSYKPQLGLLLPLALLADRRWRAIAAAASTVVALISASLLLFGETVWRDCFHSMALLRQMTEIATTFWHRMPTVFAAARMLGLGLGVSYALQLAMTLVAAAIVVAIWRSPAASAAVKSAALAVATFLATPYAWDYDTIVLIFAAAWLVQEGERSGFRSWERMAVLALLTLPLLGIVSSRSVGVQLGPILLLPVLVLLLRRVPISLPWRRPAWVSGDRSLRAAANGSA